MLRAGAAFAEGELLIVVVPFAAEHRLQAHRLQQLQHVGSGGVVPGSRAQAH